MSHQTAAVPPDMHIESARSTSSNVPAQPRSDKRTRNTRCTAELPPTSRPGPERSARRSLGAPCIPPSSADSNINALCLGISAPSHRSSQLAQPGVDPKRLAVARWSLVVVRVVQVSGGTGRDDTRSTQPCGECPPSRHQCRPCSCQRSTWQAAQDPQAPQLLFCMSNHVKLVIISVPVVAL
jgi:hypothetical protein